MRTVPTSGVPHPLADASGDAVVTETRSPVVFLSQGRVSLLAAARDAGRPVILVTDEHSVLTPAFAEVWREAGAAWVVREAGGMLREGLTGRTLPTVESVLTATPARSLDDVSTRFLRPTAATAVELAAVLSVRHRARDTTLLGAAAERLADAAETPLTGWGPHEPVGLPWDRAGLTAFLRGRMPADAAVVVTGPGTAGTVTARRTGQGVEEITRVVASAGVPSSAAFERRLAAATQALAGLASTAMPLAGMLLARPGRTDLCLPPLLPLPPTPLALLIGPPGVKDLALDTGRMTAEFGAIVVGRPRIPGLLFPLGRLGEPTWLRLDAILGTVDRGLLDRALGRTADLLRSAARSETEQGGDTHVG